MLSDLGILGPVDLRLSCFICHQHPNTPQTNLGAEMLAVAAAHMQSPMLQHNSHQTPGRCMVFKQEAQTKMKVCIAVDEGVKPVVQIFEDQLKGQGGRVLYGQAPKGGLKGDAQTFLDQLNDMLK